jgi:hypothetical protein
MDNPQAVAWIIAAEGTISLDEIANLNKRGIM